MNEAELEALQKRAEEEQIKLAERMDIMLHDPRNKGYETEQLLANVCAGLKTIELLLWALLSKID